MNRILALCLVAVFAAAGCGGSDDNSSSSSPSTTESASTPASGGSGGALQLKADKSQLKFDKTSLSAAAGTVTIEMENPSPLSHDVAIKGNGVDEKGPVVGEGKKSTVTADLKAGSYTFYCSVPAHEAGGMKGTLTVK